MQNGILSKNIKIGLDYLTNTDFSKLENGKYEIVGDEVYVIIQEYNSKPIEEGKFEAHKKYTDIQYVIKGEEQIGVGNINNFTESTEYDAQKDIVFLTPKSKNDYSYIKLKEKEYAIFTPSEAHMPSLSITASGYVKKAVVKALA